MDIPIAALKAKYEEMANLFITDINATIVTLQYSAPVLETVDVNFDDRPKVLDEYGGRSPLENLTDHANESGENLQSSILSEDILARVYWVNKAFSPDGKVYVENQYCKIITYASNEQKLRNAIKILVNGQELKLFQPPVLYGLFGGKQYCCSYWIIV